MVALALLTGVLADDILETAGFNNCNSTAPITVEKINISYNNSNQTVTFDIAGTSSQVQNVTAVVDVTAYGQQIYSNTFDPCDEDTFMEQLCPGAYNNMFLEKLATESSDADTKEKSLSEPFPPEDHSKSRMNLPTSFLQSHSRFRISHLSPN